MALKQLEAGVSEALWHVRASGSRERVSATMLDIPGMWTMSAVHSAMNASCHCCLGVQGSEMEGRQQQLVVSPQLELAALLCIPEVADGRQ